MAFASDDNCGYDDRIEIDASDIVPTVTWGINPGQAIGIDQVIPDPDLAESSERTSIEEAIDYMKLSPGAPIKGTPVDVAFIGSCTNGRLSDLEEVAARIDGHTVKEGIKAIVVPGSQVVSKLAEEKGLDRVFRKAGFEWRSAGCSMCLAMNPDKLIGDQLCAKFQQPKLQGQAGESHRQDDAHESHHGCSCSRNGPSL